MSPNSEETQGHTGQELRVSLDYFFSLTVLRFVVTHRRPPDYATCTDIFIPYLSQEHRVMLDLKLLESFLTCKTSTTRELPKELRLFCCVNVRGGRQQIERK